MNASAPPVPDGTSGRLTSGARWARRTLAVAGLLIGGAAPSGVMAATPSGGSAAPPVPAVEASGQLPAARWQQPGWEFVVELAADPSVGASPFAAMAHYAIGVAALPVTVVQPQIAFALPFYLLLAAPWQAVFNARADTLARVLVAEPLPEAVVQALRAQWRQPAAPSSEMRVTLRLAAYGLMARSGRKLEAFDSAEDLCLVAQARLEMARGDGAPLAEDIVIGPQSTTRDAPPPLCAPLSRWAAEDGRLLRLATREMAELLAAFIVDRAEQRP